MKASQVRNKLIAFAVILLLCFTIWAVWKHKYASRPGDAPGIITVRFGMLPYGDHTYAIIGAKQGWFKEVGINLDYRPVKIEDVVPFLQNGSLDAGSVPPGIVMTAYSNTPGVVSFVFGDIFQGYAIMARPDKGYKSVSEFTKGGLPLDQAIRATVQQLKGQTFAYPAEAAIKPFIDLALSKGNLSRNTFKSLVLDDPLTVNAIRNHQADFQTGGVPSRLILEREGFKPILSSRDLASAAKPSPESEELSSIFTDGWACTRTYYNQHRDTVLRLASVNFRITKFMNDHTDQALAIHMPYLSQVTGQPFTAAEGRIFYTSLDPFYTFEQQKDWYHDPSSPYYYLNLNGAIINSYIKQGVFKGIPPTVADVSVAEEVYRTLEELKAQTESLFTQVDAAGVSAQTDSVRDLVSKAHTFYDAYDYLDSESNARNALAALQHK